MPGSSRCWSSTRRPSSRTRTSGRRRGGGGRRLRVAASGERQTDERREPQRCDPTSLHAERAFHPCQFGIAEATITSAIPGTLPRMRRSAFQPVRAKRGFEVGVVEPELQPPVGSGRPEREAVEAGTPRIRHVGHRLAREEDDSAGTHDVMQVAEQREMVGAMVKALEEDRRVVGLGRGERRACRYERA